MSRRIPFGTPNDVAYLYTMHERARHIMSDTPMQFMLWAEDRRKIKGYEAVDAFLRKLAAE